jgi:hypothetical protein
MRALGLAAELGFGIACPMLVCIGGGYWADQQFNTKPVLVLLGILGGLVLAFGAMYNLVRTPLGDSRKKQTAPAAPGADSTAPPPVKLEGTLVTGNLQVRLNNAVDDLLARLERVGDAEDLAQARQLRQALAPAQPDLDRLVAIQSYFAARESGARDAADHFFSDPVVTEILNTMH